jgi:hypothetical protein
MADEDDYEVFPVEIDGKRLDFTALAAIRTGGMVQPPRFFRTYGFLWELAIKEEGVLVSKGKFYAEKITGENRLGEYLFFGGKSRNLEIMNIVVGTLVPEEIRDAVLYHEIREAFWRLVGNLKLPEAHARAMQDEMMYVARYFSPEELETLKRFQAEVQTWEPRELKRDGTDFIR